MQRAIGKQQKQQAQATCRREEQGPGGAGKNIQRTASKKCE